MTSKFDFAKFEAAVAGMHDTMPESITPTIRDGVKKKSTIKFCRELRAIAEAATAMADIFDPVRPPIGKIELFAPSTIGRLIGQELTKVDRQPFASVGGFYGSGVYAIYYQGDFPAYAPIAHTDCPIYVGVAHPRIRDAKTPIQQGKSLADRLAHHRKTIVAADKSISIADFQYRYLVTESGWQGTAEEFLIWLYKPVWNKEMKVCSGFGKHGDRVRTELSSWDILHSGRKWSAGQSSLRGKDPDSVKKHVHAHFMRLLHDDPIFWSQRLNSDWINQNAP